MKNHFGKLNLFFITGLLVASSAFAQAPQLISYQAVARNSSGNVLLNQNLSIRFSIRNLTSGGAVVYRESHNTTTNSFGSFTVNIGAGVVSLGTFTTINWGTGNKFVQVEMDPAGGVAYLNMGTQQMLSVPYAFVSGSSSSSWNISGNSGTVDGTSFLGSIDNIPLSFRVNNQKAGRIDNSLSNTFLGYLSGSVNTTGDNNTGFGHNTLLSTTTGDQNTAIGVGALLNNVAGNYATAAGYRSQYYANNQGASFNSYNTSFGWQALLGSITPGSNTGTFNTAVGSRSMEGNTTGSYNTSIGFSTLDGATPGNFNTATGHEVLTSNTGNSNTGTGYHALFSNTSGIRNTAYGEDAMYGNTQGIDNTSIGPNSMRLTTISNYNTALGASAGAIHNNGGFNTFIGHAAYANAAGYSGSTCLGDNTTMTASNQVRIGSGTTSIGGPQNWSNTSDARIKLNINENVPGLAFIKLLRPVTYNKSIKLENEIICRENPLELSAGNNYEKILYTGFIAQEVEAAAKEIGFDFSGVDGPKNEKDLYSLRYAEFVVPLVKAVQEQQIVIDDQKKMLAEIFSQNEKLKSDNLTFRTEIEKIKSELGMNVRVQK